MGSTMMGAMTHPDFKIWEDNRSDSPEEELRQIDPNDGKDAYDKIETWIQQAKDENRGEARGVPICLAPAAAQGHEHRRLQHFGGSKLHPIHLQQLSEAAQGLESEVRRVSSSSLSAGEVMTVCLTLAAPDLSRCSARVVKMIHQGSQIQPSKASQGPLDEGQGMMNMISESPVQREAQRRRPRRLSAFSKRA